MHSSSRIVKGARPLPSGRIPAAVHEADQRVREMVEKATAEANRIRAEAEVERASTLAEAVAEGRREGLARAGAIISTAVAQRDRLLAATEREVVSLALAIARKVLGREVSEPARGAVLDLAGLAIREARQRRHVTLRVSPQDSAGVRAHEGRLGALLARGSLVIREDPSLSPGDVIVETESGLIDARIETQLTALARAIEAEAGMR